MSIANEITRLQNAKSAIATAISQKGVSVPANTKLDGMAALIGNIPQGGALDVSLVHTGSAIGGTTYYIDANGQGQSVQNTVTGEFLKGSYFVIDFASAADGFYLSGCELVKAYGPVKTTVDDDMQYYVLILKITDDNVVTMI